MSGDTRRGLLLALLILVGWLASLLVLLHQPWPSLPAPILVLAVLVRTFLQTGLFIVAHDAMHQVLLPDAPRLNGAIGRLALLLYAVLPWQRCLAKHRRHHHRPGTAGDPDFHAPGQGFVLSWYLRFLTGYLRPLPLTLLVAFWAALALASSPAAVLVFVTLPLLFSSLQLFLVGTYLPHRGERAGGDHHHAISLQLPEWLSLLACYHFGYHREHHLAPHLAWHQLPGCRRGDSAAALAVSSEPL